MSNSIDLGLCNDKIVSVVRTDGTGAPGTVDTYTITLRSGDTYTFQVTNGSNFDASPSGVFATLTDLETEYPTGNNHIYVVSETGHWYYWSSGAWNDGGVYQATEISNESITPEKTTFIDTNWNLLTKGIFTEQAYLRWDNTITSPASDFYYEIFNVKPNTNYFLKSDNNTRFIVMYDENGSYLRGMGSDGVIPDGIISIPSDTYKVAITFYYQGNPVDMIHQQNAYFTEYTEEFRCYKLKDSIKITDDNFIGKNVLKECETRLPTICFIFDDGTPNDKQIVDVFNKNNYKCGFALVSTITQDARVNDYLDYQKNGFSILSHSIDGEPMSNPGIVNIMYKLITSKETLEGAGFDIKGFVTPSSQMNNSYLYMSEKVYDFAYTQYWNDNVETDPARQLLNTDMNKLHRRYLGTSLQALKDEVDACITDGGCLTFYYHSADLGTDLTTTILDNLLQYIRGKEDMYQCKLLAPNVGIPYYFRVRHKDYLQLLNSINTNNEGE